MVKHAIDPRHVGQHPNNINNNVARGYRWRWGVCVLSGFTPCRIRLTIANASLAEPAVYWKDDAVDLDGSRTCTSSTAEAAALLSNKTKAIRKSLFYSSSIDSVH